MAAYQLNCNARNSQPIAQQVIAAAEDVVTVRCQGIYRNKATVQMRSTQAFRYSKTQGIASLTVGYPVDANQPFSLTFADGEVFYIFGAAAGTIEYLVTGD
jgi:hypothetical protein